MKPRINLEQSLTLRCPMWHCRGYGFMGLGYSPKDAYNNWVWRLRLDPIYIEWGRLCKAEGIQPNLPAISVADSR